MLERFTKRLRRIGNSLGLLFPQDLVRKLGWQQDDNIKIEVMPDDQTVKLWRDPLPGSSPKPKLFRRDE